MFFKEDLNAFYLKNISSKKIDLKWISNKKKIIFKELDDFTFSN